VKDIFRIITKAQEIVARLRGVMEIEEDDDHHILNFTFKAANATYTDCVIVYHDPEDLDVDECLELLGIIAHKAEAIRK
jgi:hypothetical protein